MSRLQESLVDLLRHDYLPALKEIIFHDRDPILRPISVLLPDIPQSEYKWMDNYGYPLLEQKYRRQKYPAALKELERRNETVEQVWDALKRNKVTFKNEIDFIKKQWEYRRDGQWVIIGGRPTYIDPFHFFYLNYWKLDIGYPHYRERDWKFFHFARFCYTDRNDFINKDEEGNAIDENGYYAQFDVGRRICFGFNYPKGRREGATYRATCINYEIISKNENFYGGLQSMDGATAKKTFELQMVNPWRKIPFFFRPVSSSGSSPKTEINFDVPGSSSHLSSAKAIIDSGLESKLDFAETANRGFYDGRKLHVLHNDECGKTVLEDVDERWGVQANCLSTGSKLNIHGLAINTSTVGEMVSQGGQSFYNLCLKSMYHKRGDSGQTTSGLYNLFMPSDEGLEGFIDIFGNSIIEDPHPGQIDTIVSPVFVRGKIIGARKYLEGKREQILASKSDKAMVDYEEEMRLYPLTFDECFVASGSGAGFNIVKLQNRISDIRYKPELTQKGNLIWTSGKMSRVEFVPNIEGRWFFSKILSPGDSNKWYVKNGEYYPGNADKYTTCGDPFKFLQTEYKRMSFAGGATFMHHDPNIDPLSKDIGEYLTNRFVSDYLARPSTTDDFIDDMLKECFYWGSMMFPEINHPALWDGFVRSNCNNFLKRDKKPDGIYKNTPGFNSVDASKQILFNHLRNYIEVHCEREKHIRILEQCKSIKGIEDMKNWDLVTAAGGAIMGANSDFDRFMKVEKKTGYDIGMYFGRRR